MSEGKKKEVAPGGKRGSANRKQEVVLRLLRGESVDALSRELGVEISRLSNGASAPWLRSIPGCANAATIRPRASSTPPSIALAS